MSNKRRSYTHTHTCRRTDPVPVTHIHSTHSHTTISQYFMWTNGRYFFHAFVVGFSVFLHANENSPVKNTVVRMCARVLNVFVVIGKMKTFEFYATLRRLRVSSGGLAIYLKICKNNLLHVWDGVEYARARFSSWKIAGEDDADDELCNDECNRITFAVEKN